jgi:plastocyanin
MMHIVRLLAAAGVVAAAVLGPSGCGGYAAPPPAAPTTPAAAPPGTIVITILGINGDMSFSPNPVAITPGQPIVWHNADSVAHRVVFNDGEVDTGNIGPGASSTPMGAVAAGPYHCSIHPVMVGTTVKPQ